MKKVLILLLIISLGLMVMTGCDGVTPPNGGDGGGGGEEEQKTKQVVLVELYIQDGCAACKVVEPHLESMAKNVYSRDEMILVELAAYGIYSTPDNLSRYQWYLPNRNDRSTPNILFNGLQSRIHGSTAYGTIKTRIDALLKTVPSVKLEATREKTGEGTVIRGKVKNIGNSELTGLVINGMAFRDRKKDGFRYSVFRIFENEKQHINSLAPGKEVDFTLTIAGLNWDGQIDGVIFAQSVDHPKKTVRQALFID